MTTPPPIRPALVALQPAQLSVALQVHGLAPRELLVQPARPAPQRGGWGVLPPFAPPLILDLSGMELGLVAMLLWDLRQQLARQPSAPIVLVPGAALAAQRLLASSELACLVIARELLPGALARWASATLEVAPGQLWVRLARPAAPQLDQRLLALLAALTSARDMLQAASWCYLSRRTAYAILTGSASRLGQPPDRRRRSPAQWVRLLEAALGCQSAAP